MPAEAAADTLRKHLAGKDVDRSAITAVMPGIDYNYSNLAKGEKLKATITIALEYLNQRNDFHTTRQGAERIAELKSAIETAEKQASDQGIPDALIRDALTAQLSKVEAA